MVFSPFLIVFFFLFKINFHFLPNQQSQEEHWIILGLFLLFFCCLFQSWISHNADPDPHHYAKVSRLATTSVNAWEDCWCCRGRWISRHSCGTRPPGGPLLHPGPPSWRTATLQIFVLDNDDDDVINSSYSITLTGSLRTRRMYFATFSTAEKN